MCGSEVGRGKSVRVCGGVWLGVGVVTLCLALPGLMLVRGFLWSSALVVELSGGGG